MSALTFGSVGDIIAVCGIIQQVVQALSDTRGSAPEYQGLDSELTSLAELLLQIQSLSKTHEESADLKGLNKEIESCRRTLDTVRIKISKYAASLSGKGSGNAVRDTFWKLKWQNQSDRLVEARRLVNGHYIRLQLQLSTLGINLASFNAKSLVARFDKTESMLLQITDAVQANRRPGDSNTKFDGGTVGGVLVSGYIKSTMNAIQSVLASLTPGPVSSFSVDASFEEAASQCRKLCAAIHEQCQKNNVCYRDIDFEIHHDLLDSRRMCLDGLDLPTTEDEPLDPKSVKRVRDIFKSPTFRIAGATGDDICPSRADALWFQAGLATALNRPELVKRLCVSSHQNTGVYGFVFNRDSNWVYSIVDDHLYLNAENFEHAEKATADALVAAHNTIGDMQEWYQMMYQTGSGALYFSQNRDPDETWLPLFEKAYAKVHGDYDALRWGYPGEALEDMTGGVSTQLHTMDIMNKDRFWQEELHQVNTEILFSVRTSNYGGFGSIDAPTGTPIIRTYEGHGQRLLLLRSLQSQHDVEWAGAWCNRSPEWNHDWMKRLNHSFATKNVFWISYDDLLRKYMYFDRTRTFGPEWKIAQLWAALDIAHDDDSQDANFAFTLHREGLVVICLSQLDDRYYNGLNGGYFFQLHFHLFKDGEDEYIIHSRGNYDASRSVSGEVHLGSGRYTVRLKISATRYPQSLSLSEVIKRNLKHKRSKLMQLGSHYDVAHAKGLGFAALRTKHAQREREATEMKRKAQEKKVKEGGAKTEDKSEDDGDDDPEQWDAICVAGLKVYSYDPELQLELRQHPALGLKIKARSVGGSSR